MLCFESVHVGITGSEVSSCLKKYSLVQHANLIRKYKNCNINFKFNSQICELATFPGTFQTKTVLEYRIDPVQNLLRRGKSHLIPAPLFIIFCPGFPPKKEASALPQLIIHCCSAAGQVPTFPDALIQAGKGSCCSTLLLVSTALETGLLHAFMYGLKKQCSREER